MMRALNHCQPKPVITAAPQAARGLWGHQMNRIGRRAIMCILLIAAFTLLHQKHNAAESGIRPLG